MLQFPGAASRVGPGMSFLRPSVLGGADGATLASALESDVALIHAGLELACGWRVHIEFDCAGGIGQGNQDIDQAHDETPFDRF